MKARVSLALLVCATRLNAALTPEPPPEDPRDTAKREAWMSVVLIVSLLEQGDNTAFPGIRAWLGDFQKTAATTPPPESGKPFPAVDPDALVTRNPHFWTAFYEVQPGDPGFALLHAALLLSGGEAQRAAALATFGLQRPAIPEEIRRGLNSVIAQCQSAQAHSCELVRAGIKLYDHGDYSAALKEFDAALAEWPANGCAYYERGSTLRLKAIAAARLTARTEAIAVDFAAPPDPPQTAECFASARRHDPLQLLAYQGDDPALRDGLMALVREGLPVWEAMHKHPEQPLKVAHLRDFGEACRAAGIDEFALVLRQIVVAANKHYATDDRELIQASLQRLAPAALTPPLLARISGETKVPVRQIVVPLAVESPEVVQTNAEDSPPKASKKQDTPAKSKAKGRSARVDKDDARSSKSKRSASEQDSPAKPKASAKSKKRKS